MQRNEARHERPGAVRRILLLSGMLAAGCGQSAPAEGPRLAHGVGSLDDLGAQVWIAIARRDTATLERLRLSEYEHNELVWPEQPAAREPSAHEQLPFWWRNIQTRNAAAVDRLLASYGGSRLAFRDLVCPGEPLRYLTFRALTECRLVVETPSGERRIRAFDHVIEMDGVYKTLRYYAD